MPIFRTDPDQEIRRKRWAELDELAKEAGFDEMALHETEFCLMPFFERIVEECAKIAELQGRNYSGENKEMDGCNAAARAIRLFGKTIDNKNE